MAWNLKFLGHTQIKIQSIFKYVIITKQNRFWKVKHT